MYDVCVIGSGFAGVAVATRLARNGVATVLLEAGDASEPPVSDEGSDPLFPYAATGDGCFPLDSNRSIALGGTSRRWNGVVSRFLPTDFLSRSAFGLFTDWPFGFEELRGYYGLAERWLSTAGASPRHHAEPPRETPYPVEWADEDDAFRSAEFFDRFCFFPLAFSTRQPEARAGHAVRLVEAEIPALGALPAATVRTRTPVLRLVEARGRVVAAEVARPSGELERISARQFVLAAGVLETVRVLFLSSSVAWPRGLGNRHDQLGRFVHAHPRLRSWVPRQGPWSELCAAYRSYAFCDAWRSEGLGSVVLDVNFLGADAGFDLTQETEPAADKRIRVDAGRSDRWGRPVAVLEAQTTEIDRRTSRRVRELDRDLRPRLLGTEELRSEPFVTWFHPAGGCRMGVDPRDSVVDEQGRVHGIANLYAVGAATFPTSGATNPTLTVVALGLRLGDHLIESLKGAGAGS